MIPKLAHFHWAGGPMSWLRWAGVQTFHALNPDWQVRLIRSDPEPVAAGINLYGQADVTWWRTLRDHGGFVFSTDVVFLEPIPQAWLQAPLAITTRASAHPKRGATHSVFHAAGIGAVPHHDFFTLAAAAAEKAIADYDPDLGERFAPGEPSFQHFGVDLLNTIPLRPPLLRIPEAALCPVPWNQVEPLWGVASVPLPKGTIGVHWFGGHPMSRELEPVAHETDCFIGRLAWSLLRCLNLPTPR